MKKKVLGRGISALIPNSYSATIDNNIITEDLELKENWPRKDSGLQELNVEEIRPNPDQPRETINEEKIQELAQSIREKGLLQPIIVAKKGSGYELICGERRLKAAKVAGLTKIPAIIKEIASEQFLELALIENLQREDLNPLEEARAYQKLVEERGLAHEEIAKRIGKDRTTVTNSLRLLRLPEEIIKLVNTGNLTSGHARALLGLPTEDYQRQLAHRIIKENLSVRQVEDLVRRSLAGKRRAKRLRQLDSQIMDLEGKLERRLGTKVRIFARKDNQGRIEIRYFSLDNLDKILDIIGIARD